MKRIRAWVLGGLMLILGVAFLYQIGLFGMVVWFNFRNPDVTPIMRAAVAEQRRHDPQAQLQYQWADWDHISTHLKRAVIASEDTGFMAHDGVEWTAIRQAWEFNRRQSEAGTARRRGGSTITQQLAKNLFLSNDRSYLRKVQELILAYMLETVMSKQRILELYLNVAQWGRTTFGAQAAARHYFRTDAARLNVDQSARLAAMLPNPSWYDQHGVTAWLRSRIATIRARMRLVAIP
ncbi:monofunctional biosynthetic peptidoglycan transglycosylase [Castellaniella sp.]|uniref:monofunctional biosynthetic peptidoglycan transglycosylase n=1 Tax=Castellaniella sp. TaxID=1955812 RepID=UPI00356B41A8